MLSAALFQAGRRMHMVRISTTTIKALSILEKLNALGEARNSEIADALELPRPTCYQVLQKSRKPEDFAARNPAGVARRLRKIRQLGFDTSRLQRESITWGAMAVPVFARGQILASLSVRYIRKAVTRAAEQDKLLPRLRQTAQRIGASFDATSANAIDREAAVSITSDVRRQSP